MTHFYQNPFFYAIAIIFIVSGLLILRAYTRYYNDETTKRERELRNLQRKKDRLFNNYDRYISHK